MIHKTNSSIGSLDITDAIPAIAPDTPTISNASLAATSLEPPSSRQLEKSRALPTAEIEVRLSKERQSAEESYQIANLSDKTQLTPSQDQSFSHKRELSMGSLKIARTVMHHPDALSEEDIGTSMIQSERPTTEIDEITKKFEEAFGPVNSGRFSMESSFSQDEPALTLPNRRPRMTLDVRPAIIPVILQARPNACGDACMQMVLAYYGKGTADVGTNDRPILRGLTSEEVKQKLEEAQLRSISLQPTIEKQWSLDEIGKYVKRFGPIVCTGKGHYVVIAGTINDNVVIHDPLLGRKTLTLPQINKWIDWRDELSVLAFYQPKFAVEATQINTSASTPSTPITRTDKLLTGLLRKSSRLFSPESE